MGLEGGGGDGREMGELGEGVLLRGGGAALRLLLEELLLLEKELLVLELLLLLLRLLRLLKSRALRKRIELLPRDLPGVEKLREDREVGRVHLCRLWRRRRELLKSRWIVRVHGLLRRFADLAMRVRRRPISAQSGRKQTSPVSASSRLASEIEVIPIRPIALPSRRTCAALAKTLAARNAGEILYS